MEELAIPRLCPPPQLEDGGVGSQWHEEARWDDEEVVSEVQRFIAPCTATETRVSPGSEPPEGGKREEEEDLPP